MRRPRWLPVLLGALIVTASSRALTDADDLERNRRLLERWKADPEHHARLRRDLQAFYALPAERQEAMRRLDHQLHEDLSTQTRLWPVLTRYHDWLEHLQAPDRAHVLAARTPRERLQRIRDLREREWIEQLPARLR